MDPLAELANELWAARNATGGWGYFPAKGSRVEPTAWSLLALLNSGGAWDGPPAALLPHASFLSLSQQHGGLIVEDARLPGNLAFNGLAALLALDQPATMGSLQVGALLTAITGTWGIRLPQTPEFRQDNSLRGWPWIDATFSWVEPTSWCLLSLKHWRLSADGGRTPAGWSPGMAGLVQARIEEGSRMLLDRVCAAGGWNYGNSAVLGEDLRPYIPTTAIALLALGANQADEATTRSLNYLQQHALAEPAGLALSLALICLTVHGLDTAAVTERLLAQWASTRFLGNTLVMAMALYALSSDRHRGQAFRV
jgi:hypothetical protein